MTSDGQTCYTYNEANQLIRVKTCANNQTIAEYIYDYQGNRIIKKIYENGTLQKTIYNPSKEYETTKQANNTITNTTYYYANDEIVARKNPDDTKTYYQNDHLNSSSLLTDQTGTAIETTTYYPYGEVRTGGTQSKYQYTGKEKDSETGLNYYGARYYNAHLAKFTQADTMLPDPYDPQQLNRYAYARNNPLKYKDPTGHFLDEILDISFISLDIHDIFENPTNGWNYAALAADVGGALLPGVTGGRLGIKALEHAGEGAKIAKEAEKMLETTSHVADDVGEKLISDSSKYLTTDPQIGWKVGEPINNLTRKGTEPAWSTVRQRFWKNEAALNKGNYTMQQLERMENGLAPLNRSNMGVLESLELHHIPPQREGNLYNFDILTHEQHTMVDPFRY